MGYLSCNAESAIATCDSSTWDFTKKPLKIRKFTYSDLFTATNGFSEKNLLGKGSHGHVYKAHLNNAKLIAAVKRTKQTHPNHFLFSNSTPADNEIEILSRVRYSRLVNLLGYAVDDDTKAKLIVVELMPNGSLYDWLHGFSRPPGWTRRVRFALQVAKAVHYLHSSNPPVIHRDIKSSNVLIDGEFNARLGDFGLSLRGHEEDVIVKCTPPAGTLGYLDPGYLAPGDLSTKSDVFSFGTLLLEIISGRNAIDVNYSPPSVVDWAVPAIKSCDIAGICDPRISAPEDMEALRQLAVVAARCVRSTAAKRPGMAEVVECLKVVYKRVKSPIWNHLGRHVGRVGECTRANNYDQTRKYELLDESSVEMIKTSRAGSRRNRKVSNVTSVQLERKTTVSNGNDRVVRSKSIGSLSEMECKPLDLGNNQVGVGVGRRRVGLAVKMPSVRLNKSRSMGMLQSARLVNNNGVVVKLVKNPDSRELEESKLLVDPEIVNRKESASRLD